MSRTPSSGWPPAPACAPCARAGSTAATYSWPTASPSAPFERATPRCQRGCCCCTPGSVVPWNSKLRVAEGLRAARRRASSRRRAFRYSFQVSSGVATSAARRAPSRSSAGDDDDVAARGQLRCASKVGQSKPGRERCELGRRLRVVGLAPGRASRRAATAPGDLASRAPCTSAACAAASRVAGQREQLVEVGGVGRARPSRSASSLQVVVAVGQAQAALAQARRRRSDRRGPGRIRRRSGVRDHALPVAHQATSMRGLSFDASTILSSDGRRPAPGRPCRSRASSMKLR